MDLFFILQGQWYRRSGLPGTFFALVSWNLLEPLE
jgi:hypothetical protein